MPAGEKYLSRDALKKKIKDKLGAFEYDAVNNGKKFDIAKFLGRGFVDSLSDTQKKEFHHVQTSSFEDYSFDDYTGYDGNGKIVTVVANPERYEKIAEAYIAHIDSIFQEALTDVLAKGEKVTLTMADLKDPGFGYDLVREKTESGGTRYINDKRFREEARDCIRNHLIKIGKEESLRSLSKDDFSLAVEQQASAFGLKGKKLNKFVDEAVKTQFGNNEALLLTEQEEASKWAGVAKDLQATKNKKPGLASRIAARLSNKSPKQPERKASDSNRPKP